VLPDFFRVTYEKIFEKILNFNLKNGRFMGFLVSCVARKAVFCHKNGTIRYHFHLIMVPYGTIIVKVLRKPFSNVTERSLVAGCDGFTKRILRKVVEVQPAKPLVTSGFYTQRIMIALYQ